MPPQIGGEADGGIGLPPSTEARPLRGAFSAHAMTRATPAPGKDAGPHLRRTRGLEVVQAIYEGGEVRHLAVVKSGQLARIALCALHGRHMIEHRGRKLRIRGRKLVVGPKVRSLTFRTTRNAVTLYASLRLKDLPPATCVCCGDGRVAVSFRTFYKCEEVAQIVGLKVRPGDAGFCHATAHCGSVIPERLRP